MFKPTYLYIKTHNVTGLKYFGKTVSDDPHKYMGSGTRWINHIKHHGYDVTTEILGYYDNEEECKRVALQFGIDNDIVKSSGWANLKEETIDGGFDHINNMPPEERVNVIAYKQRVLEGNITWGGTQHWTEDSKKKVLEQSWGNKVKNGWNPNNWDKFSEDKCDEIRKQISIAVSGHKNGNYGKVWCVKVDSQDCSYRKSFLKDSIPDGWITTKEFKDRKKNKTSPTYGKHWYNDGSKNYYLYPLDNKIEELNLQKRRLPLNGCCGFNKNSLE